MQVFSLIADIAGVGGAIFSLFAWLKAKKIQESLEKEKLRQNQKVKVILRHGGRQSVELPVPIRRAEFSRSEVMGRIGMIPTRDGKRFSLAYTNTPEFLERIDQILESSAADTLSISCTEQEFEQFRV
jgi:hypothetical protein